MKLCQPNLPRVGINFSSMASRNIFHCSVLRLMSKFHSQKYTLQSETNNLVGFNIYVEDENTLKYYIPS